MSEWHNNESTTYVENISPFPDERKQWICYEEIPERLRGDARLEFGGTSGFRRRCFHGGALSVNTGAIGDDQRRQGNVAHRGSRLARPTRRKVRSHSHTCAHTCVCSHVGVLVRACARTCVCSHVRVLARACARTCLCSYVLVLAQSHVLDL